MHTLKYIFFILILFCLFVPKLINSKQIIWQNTSSDLKSCKLIDSLNFIVVGDDGKIIMSSDGGDKWEWKETGLRNIFYAVDFLDSVRGAVVGDGGAFALTTDKGKNWKTGKIDTTTFYTVKMLDENTLFASGKNTCIYKSTDFGDSWQKVFHGDTNTLNNWFFLHDEVNNTENYFSNSDIEFLDNQTIIAAGVGPNILKSTDAGETWRKVMQLSDSSLLSDIDFYDGKHGIAVGGETFAYYWNAEYEFYNYSFRPYLFYTSDGGDKWEKIEITDEFICHGAKMFGEEYIYILGWPASSFVTKNLGKSWEQFRFIDYKYYKNNREFAKDTLVPKGFESHILMEPSINDKGNILAIDRNGGIFKSTDFGYNYNTLKYNKMYLIGETTFISLYDFIPLTKENILISGNYNKVYHSIDGGVSWDQVFPRMEINEADDRLLWDNLTSKDASFLTGYFADSLNGYFAGKRGLANTVKTTDGGQTWELIDNLKPAVPVSFISRDTGFAIEVDVPHNQKKIIRIMKTTNSGMTWDSINYIEPPLDLTEQELFNPRKLIFPDSVNGYLTIFHGKMKTEDYENYPNGIKRVFNVYRSNDYCQTFSLIKTFESNDFNIDYKIKFINKHTAFLMRSRNIILKTTDDFQTFEELLLPGNGHVINDLEFIDDTIAVAVGRRDTIFTTYDGGQSWKIEQLPFQKRSVPAGPLKGDYNYEFYKINKTTNGDLFIIGPGRIVRGIIVDFTKTDVEENKVDGIFTYFYYISVIPNPVTNIAKINLYGLHYTAGKKLFLRIYDINGQLVKDISALANMNKNQNTAELEVDLSDIPTGIYFIELESNNLVRATKFLKY